MRPAAAAPAAAARAPPRAAAAPRARRARRRAARAATSAAGGPAADGDEPLDIDALAARLSAEAERRRRAGGGAARGGYVSDPDAVEPAPAAPPPPPAPGAPVAMVSPREEAEALRRVGPGGFSPDEFELVQELGRISIQTVEDSGSDSSDDDNYAPPGGLAARLPGARTRSAVAAVVAYAARFYSGMPFQDPVPVLLKEYLPAARAVALNELAALKALVGVPPVEDKWRVASAAPARDPPVVQLLGYFMAAPSARGAEAAGGADVGAAAAATSTPSGGAGGRLDETVWVVSRWDGLAPLSLYPAAQQTSGLGLGALFGGGGGGGAAARARFLRAVARGALRALAFCHSAGVAHGSLGAGSILLSTFDDAAAARLIVKLSDFGFARVVAGAESAGAAEPAADGAAAFDDADTPLALARAADLRALAAVFLEAVLAALALGGPEGAPSAEAVARVLGDVYEWDVDAYAAYVRAEPAWEAAAVLLDADGGAGWALVAGMAAGRAGAGALAEGRFCSKGNL
jgi:hypothetical protein